MIEIDILKILELYRKYDSSLSLLFQNQAQKKRRNYVCINASRC